MDIDPASNNTFNKAMAALTTIVMKKILEIYEGFEELTTLVDIAGGTGKCLNIIISKYPSIKGINFDLPHVIESSPSYSGIQHVGGSMFTAIPRADAIMIKDTLHNWNDENCIKILKNCYEALPSKGRAIVIDLVLPEAPEASAASMYASRLDNTMLMQPGGQERTEREFRRGRRENSGPCRRQPVSPSSRSLVSLVICGRSWRSTSERLFAYPVCQEFAFEKNEILSFHGYFK